MPVTGFMVFRLRQRRVRKSAEEATRQEHEIELRITSKLKEKDGFRAMHIKHPRAGKRQLNCSDGTEVPGKALNSAWAPPRSTLIRLFGQ
ncbi:hypothetical protein PAAG_12276 [Paracoccidioides lutzii Pb01]|uniref:Uncharacterized protein n=1 Tax=Paracoccidioides lutzii (strain ATCC MYA-826 / Pb01) TaxID=502779 RepID=A0A0A2V4E5_PARBA|nr:hypothetical protein PAAG_12276 [Paracoccidioides lutzii Pb01]KGQ01025.1 hypothetical protein PAAG_12276 [Paracoccidioides lutzii Pb01]